MSIIIDKAKELYSVISVGDVHGRFGELGYLIRERYKITNSIICLCGDIGMGFHKPGYYKTEWEKLNQIAESTNNLIFAVRGNHDDPDYFNGQFGPNYEFDNILLVPDYYYLETKMYDILFVGGGISIDRTSRRINEYWSNEIPVYDEEKLKNISPDIIITHSTPTFCPPYTKDGIMYWLQKDMQLKMDLDYERSVFNNIFDYFKQNNILPKYWSYGHFHMPNKSVQDGVKFIGLDELEFYEITSKQNID